MGVCFSQNKLGFLPFFHILAENLILKTKFTLCLFLLPFWNSTFCQWYYHHTFQGYFSDVVFANSNIGMYSTSYGGMPSGFSVNLTQNGAQTWNVLYGGSDPNPGGRLSYNLFYVKKGNAFYNINSYHQYMQVDRSTNIGTSWKSFYLTTLYYIDFSAPDTSQWYFLQKYLPYYLHKYENGAVHLKTDSFTLEIPASIFFPVRDTGFIAASTSANPNNHLILKSTSGGANWSYVFNDSLMDIQKMYFTSTKVGYAAGSSGKIMKTTDGGTNWQYLNSGTSLSLSSIFFVNDTVGYAAGDSGLIIKTIDGGFSWHKQMTGTIGKFSKIFFVNDTVGFAVSNNHLYKTTQSLFMGVNDVIAKDNQILIFPNPTMTKTALTSNSTIFYIEILNALGEKIYSEQINSMQAEIDLSGQPSGVYFLHAFTENEVLSKKIMKE